MEAQLHPYSTIDSPFSSSITYDAFSKDKFIMIQDYSTNQEAGISNVLPSVRQGLCSLEIKFREGV